MRELIKDIWDMYKVYVIIFMFFAVALGYVELDAIINADKYEAIRLQEEAYEIAHPQHPPIWEIVLQNGSKVTVEAWNCRGGVEKQLSGGRSPVLLIRCDENFRGLAIGCYKIKESWREQ